MNTHDTIVSLCEAAVRSKSALASASTAKKNEVLERIACLLIEETPAILKANSADLSAAADNGVPAPMLDRLRLDEKRIAGMASALRELILLEDPIGSGERTVRPNGLIIEHIRVPLGVAAIIYEARPNVTVDAAALCIKTGNAVILRGGKEAIHSNKALASLMRRALGDCGLPADGIALIEDTSRESARELMTMRGYVDLLVPRGGAGLIRSVVENATVPVIETGAGNCHIYIDESADIDLGVRVACNAKLSRPAVCNAVETMLVHRAAADAFLPCFAKAVADSGKPLEIRGDETVCSILGCRAASEEDWSTEYDDYILAVKVVDNIGEAIAHINRYNTKHSEAIITRSMENAARFRQEIDAAAVYVNASTRFTDGGEFGFGAELGISTQKLHARGPMGLRALTTEKYLITGEGQIR